jgi:hypothetical protein
LRWPAGRARSPLSFLHPPSGSRISSIALSSRSSHLFTCIPCHSPLIIDPSWILIAPSCPNTTPFQPISNPGLLNCVTMISPLLLSLAIRPPFLSSILILNSNTDAFHLLSSCIYTFPPSQSRFPSTHQVPVPKPPVRSTLFDAYTGAAPPPSWSFFWPANSSFFALLLVLCLRPFAVTLNESNEIYGCELTIFYIILSYWENSQAW